MADEVRPRELIKMTCADDHIVPSMQSEELEDLWSAVDELVASAGMYNAPSPAKSEDLVKQQPIFNFGSLPASQVTLQKMDSNVLGVYLAANSSLQLHDNGVLEPPTHMTSYLHNDDDLSYLKTFLNSSGFAGLNSLSKNCSSEPDNALRAFVPAYTVVEPEQPHSVISLEESTKDEDEDDDTVSLSEILADVDESTSLSVDDCSDHISDAELIRLSVRDLNQKLQSLDKDQRKQLKKRRRLLKNRGYAQTCRTRRICQQKTLQEENDSLRKLLSDVVEDRNMYKAKYENLKTVIRKARKEQQVRKAAELTAMAI